jgi:peptidoglycan/LPS O-acetylase OafA/YrhL
MDGLRAIAVLMVFFGHYAAIHFHPGWMGVDIFFVLSGFLITGILFDSRDKTHRFRNFYVRRTLRIFPVFYALWLVLLVLTPVLHISWKPIDLLYPLYLGNYLPLFHAASPPDQSIIQIVANPFRDSIPGNQFLLYAGHFWSLCIEEQFYLFWPLMVFLIGKRSTLLRLCVATVILSPLLRMAALHFLPFPYNDHFVFLRFTFLRLDEFLIGGFGALMLRGPRAALMQSTGPLLLSAGLVAIAASWLVGRFILHLPSDIFDNANWIASCGTFFIDIASLGIILICLDGRNWLSRLLSLAPLRGLGKIAYGFYLFHDIPHLAYIRIEDDLGLKAHHGFGLLIPFVGTLMLAVPSYHFLERPFLRLKTRFEGERNAAA